MERSSSLAFSSSSSISSSSSSLSGHTRPKKVLVITGGSGVLGSYIARIAYSHWEDDLKEIRLLDCVPPERDVVTGITGFTPPVGKPKISFHHGDITDEEALLAGFVKADVVIHCAALVENGSILLRKKMERVNISGTQNVVRACLDCGVSALVFTGSLTQVLGAEHREPVRYDETYESKNNRNLLFPKYGDSKNQAENLVLLANGQEGRGGVRLKTCSLRCPPMYGEGDRSFIFTSIRAAKRCFGYFIPIGLTGGSGRTMQSLYIGNGAWAHILAAKKLLSLGCLDDATPRSSASTTDLNSECCDTDIGGKFYYIGDHSPICSQTNFCAQFLRPLGLRVLPLGVPFFLIKIFTILLEFLLILLAVFHIEVRCPLTRSGLGYLRLSHSFSWEKAKKELEYSPLYSHKTTLARSMEFYRKNV